VALSVKRALRGAGLQLAYFSGAARILQSYTGGAGAILRFEGVGSARRTGFQPSRSNEISPAELDRLLLALARWKLDVVSIDEAIRRSTEPSTRRRFVVLTFDGAYRNLLSEGYPVLARHKVPFTVYVPTGFVDGVAPMWWLALEQIILRHDRISLIIDHTERRFGVGSVAEKYELFAYLVGWLRSLAPDDLMQAINDLCRRYAVDPLTLTRTVAMDWDNVRILAADPLVTIGSATVNYPVFTNLNKAATLREMKMGRQVTEAALGRDVPHFAYPFGDRRSIGRSIAVAGEAGFASAVTDQPGIVKGAGRSVMQALPRISWDASGRSLRSLRVMMAGLAVENASGL
jgi:peptidoglycan/xylan/chitin deacetylase (PgdA/CDA1 family)